MPFPLPSILRRLLRSFAKARPDPEPQEPPREYLAVSDGEFALNALEVLTDRESALPEHIEEWQFYLREEPKRRVDALLDLMDGYLWWKREGDTPHDPDVWWVMGTDRYLGRKDWTDRAAELAALPALAPVSHIGRQPFVHTGVYVVSAIASLYRGGKYIEAFLENITSQTFFDRSELIIIDANSPEDEAATIKKYQDRFPNIVYRRMDYRINVYEAWNIGVEMARGRYLTNVNLDDLRRVDSFAIQAATLDSRDSADIAYQDFYYSLDDSLGFEDVARYGFKSEVPHITKNNLIAYNAPHNAPMWRRRLHDELGLFDASYRSAGDWDFWLRCLANGKQFIKINTAHVVYFHNPKGISTNSETRGVTEARRICKMYSRKLMPRHLLSSRADFAAAVGPAEDVEMLRTRLQSEPRYKVVQGQLLGLAASRSASPSTKATPRQLGAPLKVLVDGVFFQLASNGIARVWSSILPRLAALPGFEVMLLDRGSSPDVPGVERIAFPSYTFKDTAADSILVDRFCHEQGADVFVSTYYTTPLDVPSVVMIHDMIPEVLGFDLENRAWQEKQLAIAFASHHICVSRNSRADLVRLTSHLSEERVDVAYCGVDHAVFHPRRSDEVAEFKRRFGLTRDYYVLVGSREQHQGYKNAVLLFNALRNWPDAAFDIVCVGGEPKIPETWLEGLPANVLVQRIEISDGDLACAYSASKALIFPSTYEGFGLPVVEAFACGCPVVTTRRGSLAEVGADAATYVSGEDPSELREAMERMEDASYRAQCVARGLELAAQYRWDPMVQKLQELLTRAVEERELPESGAFYDRWKRLREIQADVDWHLV